MIVNPLVIWIWIGALVALGGGAVLALAVGRARRRVHAAYAWGGPRAGESASADGGLGWRFSRP